MNAAQGYQALIPGSIVPIHSKKEAPNEMTNVVLSMTFRGGATTPLTELGAGPYRVFSNLFPLCQVQILTVPSA